MPLDPTSPPPPAPEAIARFWAWVQANLPRLAAVFGPNALRDPAFHAVYAEFSQAAHRLHPLVALEMQGPAGDALPEVVITCGGIRNGIPIVQAICAAAPDIPGWHVRAFRPPVTGPFELQVNGRVLAHDTVRFVSKRRDGTLDLTLYLPGYRKTPERAFEQAAMILLDHTIGEYRVMTRIGAIDFRASGTTTPRAAQSLAALPGVLGREFPESPLA